MVFILGVAASISLIIMSFSRTPKTMLWCSVAAGVFSVLQYTLLGELPTVSIAMVNIVRAFIGLAYLRAGKQEPRQVTWVILAVHAILFFTVLDMTSLAWYSLLPFIGAVLLTVALSSQNVIFMKSLLLVSNISWLMFEFQVGAFGQMIGEFVIFGGNLYTLISVMKATKIETDASNQELDNESPGGILPSEESNFILK